MIDQQSEKQKLKRQNSKQAINMALEGNWKEAVNVNKTIIADFPGDVDAHNRLGRAYMELGEYANARDAYKHAIELDPYNVIAKKNIERLSYLKGNVAKTIARDTAKPQHFIEEVGKAGVIRLINLAPKDVLARIAAGDKVELIIKNSRLTVEKHKSEYIGQIEPRFAQRLIRLMQGGNKYSAAITSASGDNVSVLVRETYQAPALIGQISFPARQIKPVRPYLRDRILEREVDYDDEEPGEEGFEKTDDGNLDEESNYDE